MGMYKPDGQGLGCSTLADLGRRAWQLGIGVFPCRRCRPWHRRKCPWEYLKVQERFMKRHIMAVVFGVKPEPASPQWI